MQVELLDAITQIKTELLLQNKCCKDFNVTERILENFNTSNMFQYSKHSKQSMKSNEEEAEEDLNLELFR